MRVFKWLAVVATDLLMVYWGPIAAAEFAFERLTPVIPTDVIIVLGGDNPSRFNEGSVGISFDRSFEPKCSD